MCTRVHLHLQLCAQGARNAAAVKATQTTRDALRHSELRAWQNYWAWRHSEFAHDNRELLDALVVQWPFIKFGAYGGYDDGRGATARGFGGGPGGTRTGPLRGGGNPLRPLHKSSAPALGRAAR